MYTSQRLGGGGVHESAYTGYTSQRHLEVYESAGVAFEQGRTSLASGLRRGCIGRASGRVVGDAEQRVKGGQYRPVVTDRDWCPGQYLAVHDRSLSVTSQSATISDQSVSHYQ
jgi:hypothetical protein